MKKNMKNYTVLILITAFLTMHLQPCFALSFDFLKKENKSKQQKQEKQVSEKKQNVQVEQKSKRQLQKEKESTVTAKTDKNKHSVRIIVKEEKEKKPEKEPKIKNKRFKKADPSKTKKQTKEPVEINLKEIKKQEPKQTNEKEVKSQEDDAFSSSSNEPRMEAAVSTSHIISVDDCVKIALENNPTILSQLISKDIYKNKIAQAWSNYFPTINANISYSKNDMLMTNFKFPMQEYGLWNMPSVGFNQLIYDFGKTGAQAGVAKKTYEAAQETLQANINDVVYQVKSAYYNQLFLQQQVEVYEDSVLQYQIHLKQAQAYYAIGSKAKIDVSTAAYNLDNTKLTLIQSKNSVENGFAQLTNAMGVPEFAPFDIKDRLDKKRYDITFDEALTVASDQSPTLTASKKKMEGSKLLIKSTKVAFMPNLDGFGNYTKGGKNPGSDYGYQIGAKLSYSNLNLLLLKQQIDEANLTYRKDQADYETQRQRLYLDVKQAYIKLKNAQQSIPVARASMDVAKERYDLASGRYKVGMGDAIELKDAQIEYVNSKLQYYNTLMQYHISAANLERVIGAPLMASDTSL